ncbi:MAG TPA: phosphoribosylformylglycinamidine synthase subunit PurS [Bacteroidetes bacterium]|nr:phosphoribosylformylglycinamidine synthase subunit PurS [bacterium BMS3Bbin04]HDO66217.1 phosphoribosylformylglycinamidine synthase subunit PurS [Bacteroidota bacterium]HEX05342.1 phosphoribosylformylglycinamidine synthase subunit PurS [Bacteroidota bacterium]
MKVIVEVMPKDGILDPQGKAVQQALHQLGYGEVRNVRVGKRIVLNVEGSDKTIALKRAEEMADTLLANENVEGFKVHLAGGKA